MDYITGLGFLGSCLQKRVNAEHIPHELIRSVKLKPFKNFYFLSTYGNLIHHTDENKIIQANVLDLIHILKQVDYSSFHSFVYVSSSSVSRRFQTFYSRMKNVAETILLAYAEKYNVPITIVRPLSITGVGDQEEHLIPTLIRSSIEGSHMPFVKDAFHDYIDVEDVVDGILTLSKHRARGIFELGTGVSRSNQEVREIVEGITGKTIKVKEVSNMRSYDSREWVSTNYKARQYGWKPLRDLPQTIQKMVDSYDK